MAETRPIIVIKKKVSHGGHHGGAWKVAYADFVTAMMALFIVLWLMNSSKQIQEAVSGYFKDPSGTAKKTGTAMTGSGENFAVSKDNMEQIKQELMKNIRKSADLEKLSKQIEMTVTAEGLRIELMESATGTFFESGSAKPSATGAELMMLLAEELGKLPNKVFIEGHTDSTPYSGSNAYDNWELSTDRANAARHMMQQHGLGAGQVTQVRGFADQKLRNPKDPFDPANRRISFIVQYVPSEEPEPPAKDNPTPASPPAGHR